MKDLQELFETLPVKDFYDLAAMVDKKSLNPQSVDKVLNYISVVYCGEMGVNEATLSNDEMDKLLENFNISISLYEGVLRGYMRIVNGRIRLTDNNHCSLQLTPDGISHAKTLIGKKN